MLHGRIAPAHTNNRKKKTHVKHTQSLARRRTRSSHIYSSRSQQKTPPSNHKRKTELALTVPNPHSRGAPPLRCVVGDTLFKRIYATKTATQHQTTAQQIYCAAPAAAAATSRPKPPPPVLVRLGTISLRAPPSTPPVTSRQTAAVRATHGI